MTYARIPKRAAAMRNLTARDWRVLTARDWRVLTAIASHIDNEGRAFPSLTRIAALTAIDRTKVPASIKKLLTSGLLSATPRRADAGDAASTVYQIIFKDGVLPLVGTPVPKDGNTVLPLVGTRGVAAGGNLTNLGFNKPLNKRRVRAADGDESARWFEIFWRTYPSRKPYENPRKPALLKFEAAVKRGVDPAVIIRGVENFAVYAAAHIGSPKFIKTAEVWLNKECWNDHQEALAPEPLRAGMI